MSNHSPNFRDPHKNSNSPVPLRSPSPDFMTKSTIVSTPPATIQYKHTNKDKMPIIQEVRFLREQNNRLMQIATSRGGKAVDQSALAELLKEKQKVIESLQDQLKVAESNKNKGSILNASGRFSSDVNDGLKIQNDNLRVKVKQLLEENDNLRRGRNNQILSQQLQLTKSQIQKLKQQISRQLNSSVTQMMNTFSFKLQDIQRRVSSIENKLFNRGLSQFQSGQKGSQPTVANVSPTPSSKFNTDSKNVFVTPSSEEKKYSGLMKKIDELQNELYRTKSSQHVLKIKLVEYEDEIRRKADQINRLQEQLTKSGSSMNKTNFPALTDSQSKNKYFEENISLKQTLTKLSGQVSTLKNQKLILQKEIDTLQNQIHYQRQLKIQSLSTGANETDQHIIQKLNQKIQEVDSKNKTLINESIAIKDTLNELRRTHAQTLNQFENIRKENNNLRFQVEGLDREKNDLKVRIRADSNVDIQAETETMKLRLRINQLERLTREAEFTTKQLNNANNQLNNSQSLIRQLKSKIFQVQNQNNNLKREAQKYNNLVQQNEMLKRTINGYQRSQQDLLKGSDHTKNQLMRTLQEKTNLQNQIIQLKSNLKISQSDLLSIRQRVSSLEKQYRSLEQTNDTNKLKINQGEINLHKVTLQRDHLNNENKLIREQFKKLQTEYHRLRANNQKQDLLNQVNILTTKLRQSQHHLTNSKRQQLQKSNELQIALFELSEVKRLLQQVNFDSIEAIVKQLQHKQKISFEQKQQLNKLSQQSSQQITKLALDNDRLKKQLLDINQKFIEQKQRSDRLVATINQLDSEKQALNERISRLDQTIKEYISQDNTKQILFKLQQKMVQSTYFDQRLVQRQLQEIDYLKQPINKAIQKVDRVAQKITHHIEDYKKQTNIVQTQSYVIPPSNVSDSRRN